MTVPPISGQLATMIITVIARYLSFIGIRHCGHGRPGLECGKPHLRVSYIACDFDITYIHDEFQCRQ